MLNLTEQHAADRLADDVADIDETLTELFLRIHAMRQRWPRDSDAPAVRLPTTGRNPFRGNKAVPAAVSQTRERHAFQGPGCAR